MSVSDRMFASDAESNSVWAGTAKGTVSQLALTARKVDSRLVYHVDCVQTLQLTQVTGQLSATSSVATTINEQPMPASGKQQQQRRSPFQAGPRHLTLSSSASSYGGSNGIAESIRNPLYQSPVASGIVPDNRSNDSGIVYALS